jgi:hypothetical protein
LKRPVGVGETVWVCLDKNRSGGGFFVDAKAVFEHTILLLQYPAGGYLKLIFEGVSIF